MHRLSRGRRAPAALAVVLALGGAGACGADAHPSVSAYSAPSGDTDPQTPRGTDPRSSGDTDPQASGDTDPQAARGADPWTPQEAAWLEGIRRMTATMEAVYSDGPVNLTPGVMRDMAARLRTCGDQAVALGPPSARLRPVRALVDEGCSGYAAGARCLTRAAEIGVPFAGSRAQRLQSKAIECGFRASGRGGVPLGDALSRAEAIASLATR